MTQSPSDSEDDESVQAADDDDSMDTEFSVLQISDKSTSRRRQRESAEDLPTKSQQGSDSDSTAEVDGLLDD